LQFQRSKLTPDQTPSPSESHLDSAGKFTLDFHTMLRRSAHWDALAASPLSPNPYFSRSFVASHVESGIIDPAGLRFIVLGNAFTPTAILPLLEQAARFGWTRIDSACSSPFMMDATPLVSRDAGSDWAGVLLAAIARHTNGGAFILPRLALDSAVAVQLIEALRTGGWQLDVLDAFQRPVATMAASYEAYAAQSLSKNRRKGIRRLRHRLVETGAVRHEIALSGAVDGQRLAYAVEAFLTLEARGWKGERGTALASRPETAAMLRKLHDYASDGMRMRADLLLLDEKPIAISLGFVNCGTGFMWKITLDEDYRKFAPGVILEDAILRSAHRDPAIVMLDSATGLGTPLDSLYGDRTPIGDLVFAPAAMGGFPTLLAAEKLRRRMRSGIKLLRNTLLRRR
jgi:CelD/BcsL family acetyltransferase involved in cellulose biosynthesis